MYPLPPPFEPRPDPAVSPMYRYEWLRSGELHVVKIGFGWVPLTDPVRQAIEQDTERRRLKGGRLA